MFEKAGREALNELMSFLCGARLASDVLAEFTYIWKIAAYG